MPTARTSQYGRAVPAPRRVLLVRHCQSSGRAADAPLTAEGHAQALALPAHLVGRGIDRVISSPHLRARQTIAPFAARTGLPVDIDDRLVERRLSIEPSDAWEAEVRASFTGPDRRVAAQESARDASTRGLAVVHEMLDAGHHLPVLVTHGQLLALVLHAIDERFGFDAWRALTNPDAYVIERAAGGALCFARLWDASG